MEISAQDLRLVDVIMHKFVYKFALDFLAARIIIILTRIVSFVDYEVSLLYPRMQSIFILV